METKKTHLDLRRHFRQLVRDVLPIFLAVALLLAVLTVLFFSGRQGDSARPVGLGGAVVEDAGVPRISLLAAASEQERHNLAIDEAAPFDPAFLLVRPIDQVRAPRAERFDSPMGSEHAALTYNAQPFLISRHLGDDLNGIGGQDTDLGDPVYAVADGHIVYAGWASDGWGNVISVLHRVPPDGRIMQSFYAHLNTMNVPVGQLVRRGQTIGTVGKGDGRYLAHLHFEIRDYTSLSAGAGYADLAQGRVSGEKFLSDHRGAADDWLSRPPEGLPPLIEDEAVSLKANVVNGDGNQESDVPAAGAGERDEDASDDPPAKTGQDPEAIPRPASGND